jgi:hypothetical protein
MPRTARRAPGGLICHVLNRAAGRMTLFRHDSDYLAFLRVLQEVQEETRCGEDYPLPGVGERENYEVITREGV